MVKDRRFYPLILSVLFILSALLSGIICKMIITENVYSYAGADMWKGTLTDTLGLITASLRSSAVQVLVLYLAGYSSLALPIGFVIIAYRGICFGYTAAALGEGSLLMPDNGLHLFAVLDIPRGPALLMLYFLSTFAIACMCSLAVRRCDVLFLSGCTVPADRIRYTLAFAVLGGAIFVCDFLKLIVL